MNLIAVRGNRGSVTGGDNETGQFPVRSEKIPCYHQQGIWP
jgi:hypothetical protein